MKIPKSTTFQTLTCHHKPTQQ